MKRAPENCIVCDMSGASRTWNGMTVRVCPHCGLAWQALFDLPEDYYVEHNEGKAEISEEKAASRLRNAQDRLALLEHFLPRSGICDIGCGDGSFILALRDKGYRECWGIEPSSYARRLALRKQLDVVGGDIRELAKAGEQRETNALTLFHVIEHVPDPVETLRILRDSLGSGGILVLETPDSEAALQKVTDHKNSLIYPEHLFYWNEKSLRTFLEKSGFKVLLVTRRSFDWKNAPLSSSLLRLGILAQSGDASHKEISQTGIPSSKQRENVFHTKNNLLRTLARTLLTRLVHALGRDDYLLVVARRL